MESRLALAAKAGWDDRRLAEEAVALAAELLKAGRKEQRMGERYEAWKLNRMLDDPLGKAFAMSLADQVFRPRSAQRAASQFRHLIAEYGAPEYLPLHERIGLMAAAAGSWLAPDWVMAAVTSRMRGESRKVVLPGEGDRLAKHIAKRRAMGARLNLNLLGEAILGEEEARRRLDNNIRRLESADCDYLSVKISAIFSQINVLAYEDTLAQLKEPLRRLYRAAMANPVDGESKLVNLDMEEFRDLHLTCDAFKAVLGEPEFQSLEAGIVLQAYLPDSFALQQDLTAWALERRGRGGAGIKLRLVKGANLAMEKVEAASRGWPQAPYDSKGQTDANFKRMLHYGCAREHATAVRLGVGSHNLLDIAYALLLREREGVREQVEIEMLEGMANYQARVIENLAGSLLFYAPVVRRESFHSAIAYLMRRLDENTAPENFLHDLFGMRPGGPKWTMQCERFLLACEAKEVVSAVSARQQDRRTELREIGGRDFRNEPDTDWTREGNRKWVAEALANVTIPQSVGLQIAGKECTSERWGTSVDPAFPTRDLYRYALAGGREVEEALTTADRAAGSWAESHALTPGELLIRVATELARARGTLLATMVSDASKSAPEADSEISEAIDFANYYERSNLQGGLRDGVSPCPLGVVVVAPPWNFPLAIACGGVAAALAAGNAVILKPAPETVLTAWRLAEAFWRAGVPREALQFVSVPEDEVGRQLLTDERVAGVILTGASETARLFKSWNPTMALFGETGGKNAILVTAAADPDQAVKDLVKSAFGHAGQKCSAASLAILEAELYDDESFLLQLRDAAASLQVGSAHDLASVVTPVIREPGEELGRGLEILDDGEEWLLKPGAVAGNPCLWTPGIRMGVSPGGWFHRTECFGPVLGIIRAADFEDGLRIQNDSRYGLTGGLQSLDHREIDHWREHVEVGNAYINRPITGATVQRQPFGGWKNSGVGPGAKAGGPNYVLQLARWNESGLPAEGSASTRPGLVERLSKLVPDCAERIRAAAGSYTKWWEEKFSREHDPSQVRGESNVFRYRPCAELVVRVEAMTDGDLALVLLALKTCGVAVQMSVAPGRENAVALVRAAGGMHHVESGSEFCSRLVAERGSYERVRVTGAPEDLWGTAVAAEIEVHDAPVLANGRLELLNYLREQAVSETRHRYGNLVTRPA